MPRGHIHYCSQCHDPYTRMVCDDPQCQALGLQLVCLFCAAGRSQARRDGVDVTAPRPGESA